MMIVLDRLVSICRRKEARSVSSTETDVTIARIVHQYVQTTELTDSRADCTVCGIFHRSRRAAPCGLDRHMRSTRSANCAGSRAVATEPVTTGKDSFSQSASKAARTSRDQPGASSCRFLHSGGSWKSVSTRQARTAPWPHERPLM